MKSQKLGRGLGALLGEIEEAYENEVPQKDSIIEISLKDIRPNPFQPRKHFEENSLYELGESIKNDGLLQPIIVTEDVDGYVLIAGERRLRASKLAKLKTIRAIVLNSDEQKMRQFALIENIQRDELNSIELAHAYGELIKLHNITQDELSIKIHKSRTHITNTIRLLQLSSKTQRALIEKKISTGHAKVLVGLDEKQQQLIVNSIVGQKLSVREVEATIKSIKNAKAESDDKVEAILYDFKEIKDKLSALGFKIKNSNKSLTIEFDNKNQIDIFLNYFVE
ncbi:MAG: chromosome partitioning protein ParB [Sulfurimonas sp. RIFOXYD12_FULL_33_39]|uniref:ParB/RepB/Spo0J family partition protein n=1 Tax=unclassified Sulfurimonas TaxID=2623549 RepID=UPI0008B3BE17|nr:MULTISPECIES: ParB/RepB/Spo0J family partition protein [unclassified Sulfurimonas]OHE02210.1 MAG: chromosome partitioning protein ParB [Sulfurimonas sp. RIFCSPLOWO2_12_FULL_34_6]OHE10137.1 MAG: chromosome partitioning protein ParB [Sulfurimonas sp. RIFOXYD12_FULL_33_39]OHE14642.1 MAG: chromosome partitioning protein ParB [Sulfurimonas sp. RIFOXYD2_FULL_34_21]